MDAATLELIRLHEAGWWALVERLQAGLGLVALALGAFSLIALALAGIEWAARRARSLSAPTLLVPGAATPAAPVPRAATAMVRPGALVAVPAHTKTRQLARVRTRAIVRRLAARVACAAFATPRHGEPSPFLAARPVHVVAETGGW